MSAARAHHHRVVRAAAASLAWSRNDSGSPEPEGSYCRSSPARPRSARRRAWGRDAPSPAATASNHPSSCLRGAAPSITIFSPTVINATASRRMRRASASASADDSGGKEETSRRTSRIAWWFSLCAETSARSVAALALVKALAAATPGEPGASTAQTVAGRRGPHHVRLEFPAVQVHRRAPRLGFVLHACSAVRFSSRPLALP